MKDVSVIIVNYRTPELTSQCIESIFKNTEDVDFEVIVVDNSSGDASLERLSCIPGISLVVAGSNLGFGNANNLGYEYSNGKYIFLLNSDTILNNNAIRIFYEYMENCDETIAVVGSNLIGADGAICNSYGSLPSISQSLHELCSIFLNKFVARKKTEYFGPVGYVTGADMFVRRSVVEKLGLFDPDFFMYFEDSEMQYRFSRHSYTSAIVEGPSIVHLEGQSSSDGKKTVSFWIMYFRSKFLYMRKRYSQAGYILSRLVCLLYLPLFAFKGYGMKGYWSLVRTFVSPLS